MDTKALRRIAGTVGPVAVAALALAIGLAKPHTAAAEGEDEAASKRERCATRLAVAFTGKSATAAMLSAANPQDQVDALLTDADFIERFARFTNSQFNDQPGEMPAEDSAYTLSKYLLENGKPWKDLFVGGYNVTATVAEDPNGLGYFRSKPWMVRYAGNEEGGYRLSSAYRILQNTTGIKLTATTNLEGATPTATGRQAKECRSCHYENWYALDYIAKILTKRIDKADGTVDFGTAVEGPQSILGGQTIANDKQLVEALVASDDYKVNTCRLAFKFLYGRTESTCEGVVFDKCMDAFTDKGTIQAAVGSIAKDPTFCQ